MIWNLGWDNLNSMVYNTFNCRSRINIVLRPPPIKTKDVYSMIFRKPTKNKLTSQEILDQASKCKSGELEGLLNIIQIKLEQSKDKHSDHDILRAKTIITSRLVSSRM